MKGPDENITTQWCDRRDRRCGDTRSTDCHYIIRWDSNNYIEVNCKAEIQKTIRLSSRNATRLTRAQQRPLWHAILIFEHRRSPITLLQVQDTQGDSEKVIDSVALRCSSVLTSVDATPVLVRVKRSALKKYHLTRHPKLVHYCTSEAFDTIDNIIANNAPVWGGSLVQEMTAEDRRHRRVICVWFLATKQDQVQTRGNEYKWTIVRHCVDFYDRTNPRSWTRIILISRTPKVYLLAHGQMGNEWAMGDDVTIIRNRYTWRNDNIDSNYIYVYMAKIYSGRINVICAWYKNQYNLQICKYLCLRGSPGMAGHNCCFLRFFAVFGLFQHLKTYARSSTHGTLHESDSFFDLTDRRVVSYPSTGFLHKICTRGHKSPSRIVYSWAVVALYSTRSQRCAPLSSKPLYSYDVSLLPLTAIHCSL